jgi:hypothetical protein
MNKRFYNCHAHCFTYDHVPEYFLTPRVAISWLLHHKKLRSYIQKAPSTGNFGIMGKLLLFLLGSDKEKLIRYMNFIKYGDRKTSEDVIKSMQHYYPKHTGYVFLTMDMEYMGAGVPKTDFEEQLKQLEGVKRNPHWENIIYPFIFCDPRRLQPEHPREVAVKTSFSGKRFEDGLKSLISNKYYQGIKLYPALGYYPFDKRMKNVYDFAVDNCIPLTTHCTIGPVHFKYKLDDKEHFHPFLNKDLPPEKQVHFQRYFTHPLNFECLLNHSLLKRYWGEDAPDYTNLKICLGHWGTCSDWHNYLENPWSDIAARKKTTDWPALELDNWFIDEAHAGYNYSWFTIICDLMRKYPNVYTDISYTLNDQTLLPLLKMILQSDDKIRERVLFGTDFYLVSKDISERLYGINVRSYLGNELFEQIAITNAERFLNNKFSQVKNCFWPPEKDKILPNTKVCDIPNSDATA